MTSSLIYNDSNFEEPVKGNVLFEGDRYYIDLKDFTLQERQDLKENHPISRHLNILPKNRFGEICVNNYVGWFKIKHEEYEVRSKKLLDKLEGNDQVKALIEEIAQILNNINYKFDSPTSSFRKTNFDGYSTTLEKFDYFKQLIFSLPKGQELGSIITHIIQKPNSLLKGENEKKDVAKVQKISSQSLKKIFKTKTDLTQLAEYSRLNDTRLAKILEHKTDKKIFPSKIVSSSSFNSFDTPENRFVKHFLNEIRTVAYTVKNNEEPSTYLSKEANKVIRWVDDILNKPFFSPIGRMNFVPHSSSTLVYSPGYRQLFDHFINSRFSFKSILEHLEKEYFTHGLNDIATLYEVWTYFKVASQLLGDTMYLTQASRINKDGKLKFGFSMTNGKGIKIYYNKTFSRSRENSYSLQFRPDITIEVQGNRNKEIISLDAKYKFEKTKYEEEEEPVSRVKASDIHKMHCYVDAISNCQLSIVLYPGDRFVFYSKDRPFKRILEVNEIESLSGVGAINLTPENSVKTLSAFWDKKLMNIEET